MTYSNSLALGRQRYSARNQNSVKFKSRRGNIGPVSNTIILIVLSCLLGLLYLTQVTKTNAFSYQINSLQQQQTQLQSQHNQLEVNAANLQSVERIAGSSVAGQLTQPSSTTTVQN